MESAGRRYVEEAGRLTGVVEAFADLPVLVMADLVLDEFLHAEIARVSREAPVLIVEHRRLESMPGGGANAIRNIRALGGRPIPVGMVGDDDAGRRIRELLAGEGVDVSAIRTVAGFETPVKTRVLAALPHSRPQQVVRIDRGATGSVSAADARGAAARASALLDGCRALLLTDYGYGLVSPGPCADLISAARAKGLPVTSDSRHRSREFRGVSSATPNIEEAEEILGCRLDDAALAEAGARLLESLGARELLVTRGSRGMLLFQAARPPVEIPVFGSDQVSDVTGAGDTVIAAFTLGLASGASPIDAALVANAAAGLVVMKQGTAVVSPEELTAALRGAAASGGTS
jgi:rfaE bifunctional protein kinase chain/domain